MLHWAMKSLWAQKATLAAGSGGVAAAFALVLLLDAVFAGESKQIVAYIHNTHPDVWVMQRGVSNMHMATSFVWDWKAERIAALPEVERATPILYLNTVIQAGTRNWFAYVVGVRPGERRAGPWSIAVGKGTTGPEEIVLPEVLARVAGLSLGDTASIANKRFHIVGLSRQTFSMANSIAFVDFDDLADLLSARGTVSYILVDAKPGHDPQALAAKITRSVEQVSALPQQVFRDNDFNMAMKMGVEIILIMTVIGTALAVLIVAFTAYSMTDARRRELALIKALGVPNRAVYSAVVMQTLTLTGLSYVMVIAAGAILLPGLERLVPQLTLEVTPSALLRVAAIAVGGAALAALIPAYQVARVDPVSAFNR